MRSTIEAAAISELARRALRSEGMVVHHRNPTSLGIDALSINIGDISPGMLLGVAGETSDSEGITIEILNSPGGVIAADEPVDFRVVWIQEIALRYGIASRTRSSG